ncbi:unnamed protein product [Effrenium voratum]|nr:unnamed protein product [Effrenium voratum]
MDQDGYRVSCATFARYPERALVFIDPPYELFADNLNFLLREAQLKAPELLQWTAVAAAKGPALGKRLQVCRHEIRWPCLATASGEPRLPVAGTQGAQFGPGCVAAHV